MYCGFYWRVGGYNLLLAVGWRNTGHGVLNCVELVWFSFKVLWFGVEQLRLLCLFFKCVVFLGLHSGLLFVLCY